MHVPAGRAKHVLKASDCCPMQDSRWDATALHQRSLMHAIYLEHDQWSDSVGCTVWLCTCTRIARMVGTSAWCG